MKKLLIFSVLLFLLLCSLPISAFGATLRQRYVNTASSGGNGTTNGTSGANAAYASLSAAMTAEAGDLVTANVYLVVNCSGTAADTTGVTITGFTTDATRYIQVNGNNTSGNWNTSAYRIEIASVYVSAPLTVNVSNITINNLQFKLTTNADYGNVAAVNANGNYGGVVIKNCIGKLIDAYSNTSRVFSTASASYTYYVTYINCIAIGNNDGGDYGFYFWDNVYVYNCAAVNFGGSGFWRQGGTIQLENCYSGGNAGVDYNGDSGNPGTLTTCASEDTSGNLQNINYSTIAGAYFTNVTPGSEDLHIGASSALKGAGTDLSGTFTTDIAGTTRTVPWDIGAFKYAAAGITIPANSTINVSTGTLDVPWEININTGGTLQGTTGTIRLSGNWTNSGTFSSDSGVTYKTTVVFYGTGTSTINYSTTFYNLTCATAGKTLLFNVEVPNTNYCTTITNNLILTGDASTDITLNRSNGSGSDKWAIYPMNTWTVSDVVVSYSVNLNPTYINPGGTSSEGAAGTTINWFSTTLVKLTAFYAIGYFDKVAIHWKTASEYNNAGFNLYVSKNKNGPYTKLNSSLIRGLGTSTTGKEYSYIDVNVTNGKTYYYKLEDVEFSGRTEMHGPVIAHPGLDSDGDGMTDDWEIYYGLDPYHSNNASLDPDGDGLTNLVEFLHDTDPTQKEAQAQAQEGVRIISSDESGITLELVTAEFKATPKKIDRVTYQVLGIPGYEHGYTSEPGKSQMPLKSILLGIPQGVSCAITDLDFSDVVELPGYNIYPVRSSRLVEDLRKTMIDKENLKAKKPKFKKIESYLTIDKKFYSTDEYYPVDIVSLGFVGDMRGQRAACVNISPLVFNPTHHSLKFYKKIRLKLQFGVTGVNPPIGPPPSLPGNYSKVKIYTTEEGLHRIGWDELWNAGFYDVSRLDPRTLKIYNKGSQMPIRVIGEADGIFNRYDYIEFYAQRNDSKYSKENVYWLTYAQGNGMRMGNIPNSHGAPVATPDRYRAVEHLEKNDFYYGERKGPEDIDRWFWNSYIWGGAQVNYPINLKDINLLHPGDEARMKIAYYALFDADHHTSAYLNNGLIDDVLWEGQDEHVVEINVPQDVLSEGDNTITIAEQLAPGVEYDLLVPNYFEVEYWRNFVADDDTLNFSYKSVNGGVTEFDISGLTKDNVELFDITDPVTVKCVTGIKAVLQSNGLYSLIFKYGFKPGEEKRFLALTSDKANLAERLKVDAPSNLSSSGNQADYIMISYGDFKNNLYPLEKLYRDKGLNVSVVDVEDVYDEFNYGLTSPYAIKNFLRYAYNKWRHPVPTYVLLVGDANYDYRDYLGSGKINYVPAYLLPNTPYLGETASDNWFVCLDPPQLIDGQVQDDILPDMFIGRIPARNKDEVDNVVGKIVAYANLLSKEYSKKVTLAADDEGFFEQISDNLVQYLPKNIIPVKLYLAGYTNYSQFTQGLINNIDNGTILLNYVGHGSTNLWTQEELFNTDTVGLLNNYRKYPFVVSFDCLDGYFLNLDEGFESLAEVFLRRRDAGAIACFSPTGMGIPEGHKALSEELFKSIFVDGNYRLGPATTQAKINFFYNTGGQYKDLIETQTLFGDPALSLNIERNIKVKKIETLPNNKQPSLSTSADGFANILREILTNVEDSERWKDGSKESKGPED